MEEGFALAVRPALKMPPARSAPATPPAPASEAVQSRSSRATTTAPAASPPASSLGSFVRRLDALRHVEERPPAAGAVRDLDHDMFTARARKFDFEATGLRAIHPTVPGVQPRLKKKKRPESDS